MKKYLYILKSNIMSNLQYVLNVCIGFITYFILIFIFLNLWKYIYGDSSKLINGYSFEQMVWYVIFTELLWSASGSRKLCIQISNDVKSGNIAYNINKPYNYILYILSNHFGEVIVKGILYTIAGVIMGLIMIGGIPNFELYSIPFILLASISSIIINTFMIIGIGLISFWIEDSVPLYWLYSKMLLVLGTLFPIEFFPKFLQPILNYSPVYVITYGPAKLFVNFSFNNLLKILIAQIIYIVISYAICYLIYGKGVRKLNVNGG